MKKTLALILVVMILAVATMTSTAFAANDYPNQPVTIMVAWPAGGGSDLLTRAIAADFNEFVGTNANVTNREGAGGTIGFAEAVVNLPLAPTVSALYAVFKSDQLVEKDGAVAPVLSHVIAPKKVSA